MLRQEAEVQPQPANNDRLNVDELMRYLAEMQARLDAQQEQIGALLLKNSQLEQAVEAERELRVAEQQQILAAQKQYQKALQEADPVY